MCCPFKYPQIPLSQYTVPRLSILNHAKFQVFFKHWCTQSVIIAYHTPLIISHITFTLKKNVLHTMMHHRRPPIPCSSTSTPILCSSQVSLIPCHSSLAGERVRGKSFWKSACQWQPHGESPELLTIFAKKLHLSCVRGFWIRLRLICWMSSNLEIKTTEWRQLT